MPTIMERIGQAGVVAVIRLDDLSQAVALSRALLFGRRAHDDG